MEEQNSDKDLLIRLEEENKILSDMVNRAYEQNRMLLREIVHLQKTIDNLRKNQS